MTPPSSATKAKPATNQIRISASLMSTLSNHHRLPSGLSHARVDAPVRSMVPGQIWAEWRS